MTDRSVTKQLCNCLDNECHENLPAGWQCRKVASPGATFPGEDSVGLGAESSRPRGLLTSNQITELRDEARELRKRQLIGVAIKLDLAADEIERLRAALERYGRHVDHCVGSQFDPVTMSTVETCTCGLNTALSGDAHG